MTIALGIVADNGIVVAADTEESTGYLKSETTKILHVFGGEGILPGGCIISGAGDSGYVSSLMHEMADTFLNDKTRTGLPLQQAFEDCINEFHSNHIIPFAAYPKEDRPSVEMLITHNRRHAPALMVSENSVVLRKSPFAAVGCGSIFAEILLNRFWKFATVERTQILAAYVVFMVKESVAGCGKFTQISTLHHARVEQGGETGSQLVPPIHPISYMGWEEITDLEKSFRTTWAKAEQDTLWNLIERETK